MEISGAANTVNRMAALNAALNSAQSALSAYENCSGWKIWTKPSDMQKRSQRRRRSRVGCRFAPTPCTSPPAPSWRVSHVKAARQISRQLGSGCNRRANWSDLTRLRQARSWIRLPRVSPSGSSKLLHWRCCGRLWTRPRMRWRYSSTHPDRPGHLNNLASRRSDCFRRSDDARFLETAIAALQEALRPNFEGSF